MIQSMRKTSLGILGVILFITGLIAHAQRSATHNSDRHVEPILQRIEINTHAFYNTLSAWLDQNRRNGARSEENINKLVSDFEDATVRFRERYDDQQAVAADAQELIDCASLIDDYMRRHRLDAQAQIDWDDLRLDLDQLARYYKVSWRSDAWINSQHARRSRPLAKKV